MTTKKKETTKTKAHARRPASRKGEAPVTESTETPPAGEIDAAAFEAHAAAKAEEITAAPISDEARTDIDSMLAGALAEVRETGEGVELKPEPEPIIPASDGPLPQETVREHRGGWPAGRPRDPAKRAEWEAKRGTEPSTAREPVTGKVEGDPVRRARNVERENDALRRENADLKARVDTSTHDVIRKGLGALIVMGANIAARRFGEHMRVPVEEANECGEHVGNALIPFLGDYSRYMPIVVAFGACVALAIPRMQYEEEIREGKHPRVMVDGSAGPKIVA